MLFADKSCYVKLGIFDNYIIDINNKTTLLFAMEKGNLIKNIFVLCVTMLISGVLFAQQSEEPDPRERMSIRVDSDVWTAQTVVLRSDNVARRLPQGTEVLGDRAGDRDEIDGVFDDLATIFFENNRYEIRARNLSPIGEGRFPSDWITAPDAQKRWVISHQLTVFRLQDREAFSRYEQGFVDWATRVQSGEPIPGWHAVPRNFESLVFFDGVLFIGGFERAAFFIMNIMPYNAGYRVTIMSLRDSGTLLPLSFPLQSEQPTFDLIFIPDGDFMDVYLDTLGNHFATFARVDTIFMEEMRNLVWRNTADISRITSWPRRADGSMDIPPPDGVTLAFRATHTTTARLNVRDSPTTVAPLVTTLEQGTEVQVLEAGHTEAIGELTAPWVRVLADNGLSGWVFSGFLETVAVEAAVVEDQSVEVATVIVPQAGNVANNGMPLWVFILISIGVVILIFVILFVAKKHNKAKS